LVLPGLTLAPLIERLGLGQGEERRRADAERTRAAEHAAEADGLRRAYAALVGTRRWQAVQRLMRPLDRMRLRAPRDGGPRR
ncbi:MAG TPA: hypothetical protein VNT03_22815, partial [Baekduia sp.]|nr:hypothetical protein [Baekduia sp.]